MGVRSGATPPLLLLPACKYTVGGYGGGGSLPPKGSVPYQRQSSTCGLFRTGTVKKKAAFFCVLAAAGGAEKSRGRWRASIAILEKFCYTILVALHGKVSEWFKELVLKTSDAATHRGFESHPFRHRFSEKRRSVCWYQKPIVMLFVAVFDHWQHSPLLLISGCFCTLFAHFLRTFYMCAIRDSAVILYVHDKEEQKCRCQS